MRKNSVVPSILIIYQSSKLRVQRSVRVLEIVSLTRGVSPVHILVELIKALGGGNASRHLLVVVNAASPRVEEALSQEVVVLLQVLLTQEPTHLLLVEETVRLPSRYYFLTFLPFQLLLKLRI